MLHIYEYDWFIHRAEEDKIRSIKSNIPHLGWRSKQSVVVHCHSIQYTFREAEKIIDPVKCVVSNR